jgi:predicted Rossmann fold flavoprotein
LIILSFAMLIIGAGPAGLACGIAAARCGKQTVVLEKNNRPGVKLRLTGSGQCNLTHGGSIDKFLDHYGTITKGTVKQSRFVKPALFAFPNTETVRFFEQRGVPLFEREDGKIFPRSLQSDDILRALVAELETNGGVLRTDIKIHTVRRTDDGFCVETNQGMFSSNQLAIATGGMSYPKTGSTGDGYRWAEQWGHRIAPPRPALTPVIVESYPFADAAGFSFDDVPIDVYRNGKKIRHGRGDVLLTHRGLSGPGILDLSRFLEPQDVLRLPIYRASSARAGGVIPPMSLTKLLRGKKLLKNVLPPLGIPDRLLSLLLTELGISPELPAAEVDRPTRQRLNDALTGFTFVIKRLGGFDEAMATGGGIALEEVNRQTMESRLVSGLFFCGEVLDIDGDTGGYNIQFALSSGFLAGRGDGKAGG